MNLHEEDHVWKLQPFADCPALFTSHPPSWFHRFMQKLLLGFVWTRTSS